MSQPGNVEPVAGVPLSLFRLRFRLTSTVG